MRAGNAGEWNVYGMQEAKPAQRRNPFAFADDTLRNLRQAYVGRRLATICTIGIVAAFRLLQSFTRGTAQSCGGLFGGHGIDEDAGRPLESGRLRRSR